MSLVLGSSSTDFPAVMINCSEAGYSRYGITRALWDPLYTCVVLGAVCKYVEKKPYLQLIYNLLDLFLDLHVALLMQLVAERVFLERKA